MASKGLDVTANFPIVFPANLIQDLAIQMQIKDGFENLTKEQWVETLNKALYAQGCVLRFLRKHVPSSLSAKVAAHNVAPAVQEAMEQRGEAICIQGPDAMQKDDAIYIIAMLNQVVAACSIFAGSPEEEPEEALPEEPEVEPEVEEQVEEQEVEPEVEEQEVEVELEAELEEEEEQAE